MGLDALRERRIGLEAKRESRNLHLVGEIFPNHAAPSRLAQCRFGSRPSLHRIPSQSPLPSRPSPPRIHPSDQPTSSPSSRCLRSSRNQSFLSVPRRNSPNRETVLSTSRLGSVIARACVVQARPSPTSQRLRYRSRPSKVDFLKPAECTKDGNSSPCLQSASTCTDHDPSAADKGALDVVIHLPSIR